MNKERVKTIILSVLVILSVLSIHKIWFDSPISILQTEATSGKDEQHKIADIRRQVISPKKAIIGFGGGTRNNYYTVLDHKEKKEVWEKSKLLLLDFFTGNPEMEAISYDKYLESNTRKFVEFEFGENIAPVLISSVFDTLDSKIIESSIREIKKIRIPTNNSGEIYVVNSDNSVIEVKFTQYENAILESYITEFEKKDFEKFYYLFSSVALMPINYNRIISQPFVEGEIDLKDEQDIVARTRKLFNESFDFVKTIHETSGAMNFLYGYGEKSVRINNRGGLEYKEEVGNTSSTNVVEALNVALGFVAKNGGMPKDVHLSEVKVISPNKGYYFGFNYSIEGYPLVLNNIKHAIEVEVFGNKVKTYRRLVRSRMNLTPIINKGDGVISPHKIIEENIELLIDNYQSDLKNEGINTTINITEISNAVSQIDLVYYDSLMESRTQQLTLSWAIQVSNRVYYFDSYKGKLIHSNIVN